MFCSNCGKEMEDGMWFCPACGTKADEKKAGEDSVQTWANLLGEQAENPDEWAEE